jgi:hypothetical protein
MTDTTVDVGGDQTRPRQASGSQAFASKAEFVGALHVYNNRGVKAKNVAREETREWHFKEMRARTTVADPCRMCAQPIGPGAVYYLNFPARPGVKWTQGCDPHCEPCMHKKLRKELGPDDAAIRQEYELAKANPGGPEATSGDCIVS